MDWMLVPKPISGFVTPNEYNSDGVGRESRTSLYHRTSYTKTGHAIPMVLCYDLPYWDTKGLFR